MLRTFNLITQPNCVCSPSARPGKRYNSYLTVYALATFSDWLQGPYVYALYEQYGYNASQISFLLCAVALFRTLCFGTVKGTMNHYATKYFVMPGEFEVLVCTAAATTAPTKDK